MFFYTMKKILNLLFLVLISCTMNNIKNSEKISFYDFSKERNQKNSLVLFGFNYSFINVILPNDFNSTPDNYGIQGNLKMYEILTHGKTFKNWNRMITVFENIFSKNVNLNLVVDSYIESSKNSSTCKSVNSDIQVVEKNKNSAIIVMQCGELVEGTIPEQVGKQGEITFIKIIFNSENDFLNRNFGIMYSFRGDTFKIKPVDEIINLNSYKEFYNLANETLICTSKNTNPYCRNIMFTKPKEFNILKYKIPNGYISTKESLANNSDDLIIMDGDNFNNPNNPFIKITYHSKYLSINKLFDEIKNEFYSKYTNVNFNQIYINNINLYQTNIYASNISYENNKTTAYSKILFIKLKDKIASVEINFNKNTQKNEMFANDFIKSIVLE